MEIEQRLGLYQVFLKLYAHHRSLLDEILQLEKMDSRTFSGITNRCVMGVIQSQQVYLATNLIDGKTRTLIQPQGIWTIGRDRQLAIPIPDRRLSRRHAVIQYIDPHGFHLVDLDSTNGSFVNGEPAHGRLLLKDGDRIRLGSLAFSFFLCHETQSLDATPPEIMAYLEDTSAATLSSGDSQPAILSSSSVGADIPTAEQKEETASFLQEASELEQPLAESLTTPLSAAQRSEILDRFFSRQVQKVNSHNQELIER